MSSESRPFIITVEPNRVRAGKITAVAITAIAIIVGSGFWVMADLPPRVPIYSGIQGTAPADLHMVFQTLIDSDHTTERLTDSKRERMRSYSWVDREHGVVRIPINRAMELVVEGRR